MKWSLSSVCSKIFSVQSRESEIETAVHNCVNSIINSPNEYSPTEQIRIAKEILDKVKMTLANEHLELLEELAEYEKILGFTD